MIRATISEVKNGLSAYLRRVKSGESVLVLEHRTPVARIVPVGLGAGDGKEADSVDEGAKLARLERTGIVARLGSGSPLDVLRSPLPSGAGILEALLDERSEESQEGYRRTSGIPPPSWPLASTSRTGRSRCAPSKRMTGWRCGGALRSNTPPPFRGGNVMEA